MMEKTAIKQITSDPTINIALDTLEKGKQALVFANTKRSAEKAAEDISKKVKPPSADIPVLEKLSEKALKSLSRPTKQCHRLARCIKKGIAFHHAGLITAQRDIVETGFKDRIIKIICCTPTLAAGLDLPAFRTILKDLRRFGIHGLKYIPTLEYLQMAGRAGRPRYDKWGEAIAICKSPVEKDEIVERYIYGKPEDIYSKLAVEPVLRTYLLSLIAGNFVRTKKQIIDFFEKTFWAYQFQDMARLNEIIARMLARLEEWKFLSSLSSSGSQNNAGQQDFISAADLQKAVKNEEEQGIRYTATPAGKRVAEIYIDPLTAHEIIECLKTAIAKPIHAFSFLQMVSSALEIRPQLKVRIKEQEEIQEELLKYGSCLLADEPSMFDESYSDFLNSVKTALFFNDWIEEKDEEFLLEKYRITPGEIRVKLGTADWLLYASAELARLIHLQPIIKEINKLRFRIKHGAKEELLTLLKLKRIGRVRARKMFNNKIKIISDVKEASITTLVQLIGRAAAISVKEQVGVHIDKEKVPKGKRVGQLSLEKYQQKTKSKKTDRKKMKQVITRDNSITLFNEEYQEHYHSHTVGAIEEAFVKFAKPCKIRDGIKILDVCFGLGYNSLAAISFSKKLEIIGLENDKKILEKISEIEVPERYKEDYKIIKQAAKVLKYDEQNLKIKIIPGDARETIKQAGSEFDAVFLDPFSPKKCPELWTREFFDDIYRIMNKGAVLATYSCATIVRNNLKEAGFLVKDGPIFGRKSPATIAIKE